MAKDGETALALARTEVESAGETIRAEALGDAADEATLALLPRIPIAAEAPSGPHTSDLHVTSTLGEGGMGRVHLARQRSLDRDVAVKTLKAEAGPAASVALAREARITGSLEHPGVIPVHAFGADDEGRPILVMKRVEGSSLLDLLDEPDHPLWEERGSATKGGLTAKLEILLQVCRTLEFAHARGVIHRDVKPENIMVGAFGEVYLLDWGIALRTQETDGRRGIFGTPAYMAPEMFNGGPIDERTDVYLVGATLHHLLTGRFRHEGGDILALGRSALASTPVTYGRDVPSALAVIANRAMAQSPSARFQSVQELREAITDFLHERSALALAAAAEERLAALRTLLDEAGGAPPADLAAAYRLASEARFGFAQSLREHPAAQAKEGARAAVEALVELELRQGHADTAEALLRERGEIDPALRARVAEVRAAEQAKARDQERLRAIERDRDPSVGHRSRNAIAVLFGCATAAVWMLFHFGMLRNKDPWSRVGYVVVLFALLGVMGWFRRGQILGNEFARRVAGTLAATFVLAIVHRIACALGGVTEESAVFGADLWIGAAVFLVAATTLHRGLLLSAIPMLLGALAITSGSDDAHTLFTIAVILASLGFVAMLRFFPSRTG